MTCELSVSTKEAMGLVHVILCFKIARQVFKRASSHMLRCTVLCHAKLTFSSEIAARARFVFTSLELGTFCATHAHDDHPPTNVALFVCYPCEGCSGNTGGYVTGNQCSCCCSGGNAFSFMQYAQTVQNIQMLQQMGLLNVEPRAMDVGGRMNIGSSVARLCPGTSSMYLVLWLSGPSVGPTA
uniref:Uncharacterized protein n=1 Tax=Timema douglasi TaxID=61478 RepID=A0A7R8VMY4_TIMDO|nr:unnamed protein product [Timema douglasi]